VEIKHLTLSFKKNIGEGERFEKDLIMNPRLALNSLSSLPPTPESWDYSHVPPAVAKQLILNQLVGLKK
jgi:hypothetical protein